MIEKAELHCHLDGILDPAMLDAVREAGVDPGIDRVTLAAACPAATKAEWLDRYCVLAPPQEARVATAAAMLPVHIDRLAAQRVTYVEIMLGGLLATHPDPAGVVESFRSLREIATRAGERHGVRLEFLIAVSYRDAARFAGQADRILAVRRAGLVRGVVIAGEEPRPSLAASAHDLDRLRDAGLGIEIHAGEWAGPESVRDALEHGRPDRIGHGIAIFRDEALLDEVRRRDLHVEFCPTSNLITGAVARIADHPIRRARELGMNYSVSTDDPAPFGCTMNSEYALLVREFGFGPDDFAAIHRNALRSSFADR